MPGRDAPARNAHQAVHAHPVDEMLVDDGVGQAWPSFISMFSASMVRKSPVYSRVFVFIAGDHLPAHHGAGAGAGNGGAIAVCLMDGIVHRGCPAPRP